MQPDHASDACTCKVCRPYSHGLRLVSSNEIVSTAVAEGLRVDLGLSSPNLDIEEALRRAEARLAPFRDESLQRGG